MDMNAFTVDSIVPTLRVTNLDRSIPFYSKLGFSVAWIHQLEPDKPRLAAVQHGPVQLFLTEHDIAPVGAVVYLNSRGVDALNDAAAAVEIEPTFGPEDRPWAQREVYFQDPDGNVLRFGEPAAAGKSS
jgi:catechol 2,3-dioxygenase-like lactoylglutathione lyase family enzyme